MKYKIVKDTFSDGTVWYRVQYKHWNWIPWWKNFRWHQDYGYATIIRELWFNTPEEALDNFKEHSRYFDKSKPNVISSVNVNILNE